MPQRSNAFQNLVFRIQDGLSASDSVVEESALVLNAVTGKKEEIDVLLAFSRQGHRDFRVAIHCRDQSRKGQVGWIRDLKQQREECKLDRVVAVHSSGFTSTAMKLAMAHNIDAWTIEDVEIASLRPTAFRTIRTDRTPWLDLVEIYPYPNIAENRRSAMLDEGNLRCACCEKQHGSPNSFATGLFQAIRATQTQRLQQAIELAKKARRECFEVEFLKQLHLEFDGQVHRVTKLKLTIRFVREIPFEAHAITIPQTGQIVTELRGRDDQGEIRLVLPSGTDTDPIVLSFNDHGAPPPKKLSPRRADRPTPNRNAKCPCGSGLKFKRCCMGKPPPPMLPIDMFRNSIVKLKRSKPRTQ